jgi:hypothetical protein
MQLSAKTEKSAAITTLNASARMHRRNGALKSGVNELAVLIVIFRIIAIIQNTPIASSRVIVHVQVSGLWLCGQCHACPTRLSETTEF